MANSRFLSFPGSFFSSKGGFSTRPIEWDSIHLSQYISAISQEPATRDAAEFVTRFKMTGQHLLTLPEESLQELAGASEVLLHRLRQLRGEQSSLTSQSLPHSQLDPSPTLTTNTIPPPSDAALPEIGNPVESSADHSHNVPGPSSNDTIDLSGITKQSLIGKSGDEPITPNDTSRQTPDPPQENGPNHSPEIFQSYESYCPSICMPGSFDVMSYKSQVYSHTYPPEVSPLGEEPSRPTTLVDPIRDVNIDDADSAIPADTEDQSSTSSSYASSTERDASVDVDARTVRLSVSSLSARQSPLFSGDILSDNESSEAQPNTASDDTACTVVDDAVSDPAKKQENPECLFTDGDTTSVLADDENESSRSPTPVLPGSLQHHVTRQSCIATDKIPLTGFPAAISPEGSKRPEHDLDELDSPPSSLPIFTRDSHAECSRHLSNYDSSNTSQDSSLDSSVEDGDKSPQADHSMSPRRGPTLRRRPARFPLSTRIASFRSSAFVPFSKYPGLGPLLSPEDSTPIVNPTNPTSEVPISRPRPRSPLQPRSPPRPGPPPQPRSRLATSLTFPGAQRSIWPAPSLGTSSYVPYSVHDQRSTHAQTTGHPTHPRRVRFESESGPSPSPLVDVAVQTAKDDISIVPTRRETIPEQRGEVSLDSPAPARPRRGMKTLASATLRRITKLSFHLPPHSPQNVSNSSRTSSS